MPTVRTVNRPESLSVFLDAGKLGYPIFRGVHVSDPDDPALASSFRSHYELQLPPRKWEKELAIVHMGVSFFNDAAQVRRLCRSFPKTVGEYVARVELVSNEGVNFALTAAKGHLTVWGDPVTLAQRVVEISS